DEARGDDGGLPGDVPPHDRHAGARNRGARRADDRHHRLTGSDRVGPPAARDDVRRQRHRPRRRPRRPARFPPRRRPRRAGDVHARHAAGEGRDEDGAVGQKAEGRRQKWDAAAGDLFWFLVSSFWFLVCSGGNQKPETRNQKPETRNQKPETRNQNQTSAFSLCLLTYSLRSMEAIPKQFDWSVEDSTSLYMIDRW